MLKALQRLFKQEPEAPTDAFVTVVSGLPRSGTSMMMKMLEAGGLPLLVDNIRQADEDNPKGYYEFERVKALPKGDVEWVSQAQGKAVKIISVLLQHLPETYHYKIIFMRRDLEEVLRSQRKMLIRRGHDPNEQDDDKLRELYTRHLAQIETWLAQQPHMDVLYVPYGEMVTHPQPFAEEVNAFLGGHLDVQAMVEVVDPTLYRNRKQNA
ncbi:MAG: sulfotransferase family protein [Ardenticatenia bacterium]|nr:MAG: sulfotransferase family protein [Ardenticatenia bacterium]